MVKRRKTTSKRQFFSSQIGGAVDYPDGLKRQTRATDAFEVNDSWYERELYVF